MKLVKKFVKIAILGVIILALLLCAAFFFLGEYLIKTGIETAATKALSVGVHIEDVDLSILKGAVGISGLQVRNPAGYNHPNLLELNSGHISTEISSLLSDTVHIKELNLDGITLVIEQKGLSNNLKDIITSIPPKDEQETKPSARKLRIDELVITDIQVKAKVLPIPGKSDTITLTLDNIRMSDLGGDNKLTTKLLTDKIVVKLTEAVTRQGKGILPESLLKTTSAALENVMKTGQDLGKAATEEAEKIIDAGKDIGTTVTEGLKGLLKPEEKEK